MTTRRIFTFSCLLMILSLIGCKDESSSYTEEDPCPVGTRGCACIDDACNAGLACEENTCVELTFDTEPDSASLWQVIDTETDTNPATSDITITNEGGRICANGVVVGPESNSGWGDHWGAGVGLNICQPSTDASSTKVAIDDCHNDLSSVAGFNVTFSGTLPTQLWVNFEDDLAGSNSYIIVEKATATNYLFADAAVWYSSEIPTPTLEQPGRVVGIQFQVAAQLGEVETFDFCIENVSVVTRDMLPTTDSDTADDTDTQTDTGMETDADSDTQTESTNDIADSDSECSASMQLVANENNWVDQCTNLLGVQGYWYTYSD